MKKEFYGRGIVNFVKFSLCKKHFTTKITKINTGSLV